MADQKFFANQISPSFVFSSLGCQSKCDVAVNIKKNLNDIGIYGVFGVKFYTWVE